MESRIHPTAEIESGVEIGPGTAVWAHVHVRGPGTTIGAECIVGERTYDPLPVQLFATVNLGWELAL